MMFDLASIDIAADTYQAALVRRIASSGKPINSERHATCLAVEVMHLVMSLRSRLLSTSVEQMTSDLFAVAPGDWTRELMRSCILLAIYIRVDDAEQC